MCMCVRAYARMRVERKEKKVGEERRQKVAGRQENATLTLALAAWLSRCLSISAKQRKNIVILQSIFPLEPLQKYHALQSGISSAAFCGKLGHQYSRAAVTLPQATTATLPPASIIALESLPTKRGREAPRALARNLLKAKTKCQQRAGRTNTANRRAKAQKSTCMYAFCFRFFFPPRALSPP